MISRSRIVIITLFYPQNKIKLDAGLFVNVSIEIAAMALNGTDLDVAFNMGRRAQSTSLPGNFNHQYASTSAGTSMVPATQMSAAMGIVQSQAAPQSQQQVVHVADTPQPQSQPIQRASQQLPPPPPITPAPRAANTPVVEQFSYIDSLISKKKDLGRLILFALTVVFAIAIHAFVQFAIKEISIANTFSFKQELGLRLVYPVIALLMIWFIKAGFK